MTNFYGITKLTLDEIIQRDPEHSCRNECAHAQLSTARPAITKQQLEEWDEHFCHALGVGCQDGWHIQRRDLARALLDARKALEAVPHISLWGTLTDPSDRRHKAEVCAELGGACNARRVTGKE